MLLSPSAVTFLYLWLSALPDVLLWRPEDPGDAASCVTSVPWSV